MTRKKNWFSSLASMLLFGILFWASTPSYKPPPPQKKIVTDLLPAVTTDARELTRITNSPYQDFGPSISPDGKKILYYGVNPDQVGSDQYRTYLKNLDEQGTSPLLTNGCMMPTWMPDGSGFYFKYAVSTRPVIAKSKINGGGISYVSPSSNGDDDAYPSFFKATNKILFETTIGKTQQVATVDPSGLNFTILVNGAKPSPHPTDKVFVYESYVGAKWQIFSYDFATGQQTQLTSDNFENAFARFSPDGKWIVFRKQTSTNVAHIFIMNRVGGSVKQLTTGNTWNGSPEFGPDGYIYFSSNAGNSDPLRKFDNYDIWRLKPNLSE